MKKLIIIASFLLSTPLIFAQTAYDFQGDDCNGNQVHLFSDLDAGKAVAIIYYMPNCGSCPPVAQKVQAMANKINATYPGMVKAYAYPYTNATSCTYSASWVTNNNLPLFTPMDSGAVQVAYYGGFGMPTVVILGGTDHRTMIANQDFVTSDTTIMRDSILGMLTAGVKKVDSFTESVSIFPNPSSDVVNIEFISSKTSDLLIDIMNIEGKQMVAPIDEKLVTGKVKKEINISSIPNGIYTIRIRLGDTIKTQTINIIH